MTLSLFSLNATVKKVFDPCQVTFGPTVFASALNKTGTPALFLGASKVPDAINGAPYVLSKLVLQKGTCGRALQALIQSLTPATTTVNGTSETNPLLTTTIFDLALLNGQFPVVAVNNDKSLYLLTDPLSGATLLQTAGALKDAGGNDCESILAIEGSDRNYMFAAVSQTGKSFADAAGTDRGIAIVHYDGTTAIAQQDPTNLVSGSTLKAVKIDVQAQTNLIAFSDQNTNLSITQALLNSGVDMVWSSTLQRLYIGLTDVRRDDPAHSGGVVGGCIGRVNISQQMPYPACGPSVVSFVLDPLVQEPAKALFFDDNNQNSNIIPFGFYFDNSLTAVEDSVKNDGLSDVSISMKHLAVMHTSTNKPYLIFNAISSLPPSLVLNVMVFNKYNKICAVPLIPKPLNGYPDIQGSVALVGPDGIPVLDGNGNYQVPQTFVDMPNITQEPVNVGGFYPVPGEWISDLFVEGDAVYYALNGPGNDEKGIYKSTALFNDAGFIRGWTPSELVMGSLQKVVGAGLDTQTGDFYFLSNSLTPTSEDAVNTGQISVWGKGDVTFHGGTPDTLLSSVLEEIFPQCCGGVHQIFNFNKYTKGFTQGRFSMMVAVGYGRVALIQTGSYVAGQFVPTTAYELNSNVFLLDDPVLKQLGPISCAAVGVILNREGDFGTQNFEGAGQGYLYVGGFGGVARLGPWTVTDFDNGLQNLSNQAAMFPGTMTFTKIAEDIAGPVYNIAVYPDAADSDTHVLFSGWLYVLTNDKLYQKDLDGNGNAARFLPVVNGADLVLAGEVPFVASSQGLQYTDQNLTPFINVAGITGRAVQLQYLSQRKDGVSSIPGNIYALILGQRVPETPQENNRCTQPLVPEVFRIAVSEEDGDTSASVIDRQKFPTDSDLPGPFIQYENRRSNLYADGSLLLSMQPKDSSRNDFVRLLPIVTVPADQSSHQRLAQETSVTGDLDLNFCTAYNVGIPIRDSANGAWIVPGDYGIRIND